MNQTPARMQQHMPAKNHLQGRLDVQLHCRVSVLIQKVGLILCSMIDAEKEEEEEAHTKIKYKLTLKDIVIQHQVLNNRSLKAVELRKKFSAERVKVRGHLTQHNFSLSLPHGSGSLCVSSRGQEHKVIWTTSDHRVCYEGERHYCQCHMTLCTEGRASGSLW